MPSYSFSTLDHSGKPTQVGEDVFTRLSIANCEHDEGVRPLGCGCCGWLSPALQFRQFPPAMGVPNEIIVTVRNFGSSDATGVLLEAAYNIWVGNEAEGMVPITALPIPIVPLLGAVEVAFPWTPPDADSTHACIHARVLDAYSMLHYTLRSTSWDSTVNPQVGNRNVTLVPITDSTEAVVVSYRARNFNKAAGITARTLVTEMDSRTQFRDVLQRHPLPFVPESLIPKALEGLNVQRPGLAMGVPRGASPVDGSLLSGGLRQPRVSPEGLWPASEIPAKFVHGRFGFDVEDALSGGALESLTRGYVRLDARPLLSVCSLQDFTLKAGVERAIRLVIPKEQFPPPGQRKCFRVQYQKGTSRPVEHFVYLSR